MTDSISSPVIFSQPVPELIRRRFSCRSYAPEPIGAPERKQLEEALAAAISGPLGSRLRFRLIAATTQDNQSLRGLGTYGFIRGATGFIIGAAPQSRFYLEDYGCRLEQIILLATDLGLGTCWLGGTFTQSGFAGKISRAKGEVIPAVVAIGRIADPKQAWREGVRRMAGADRRLPWNILFNQDSFATPLAREAAGPFAEPLEMVRLGPSGSNKQPWRILRAGDDWHFYLRRTKGYRTGFFQRILRLSDIQRIDLGIAMCHFELTARELGLQGEWAVHEPAVIPPDALTEYIVSWMGRR
jgi:nitroreductase